MTTAHARLLADRIIKGQESSLLGQESDLTSSSKSFTKAYLERNKQSSSSSYLLADDHSQFSRDIEHWMNGSQVPTPMPTSPTNATNNSNVTGPIRERAVQRSTLVHSRSFEQYSGMWYILAMILPLFSMGNSPSWRCTPSAVLSSAEILMNTVSRFVGQARAQIRQFSQDQVARELFATLMDIILVIYAIGFLILTMYQASIFA